MYRLVIRSLCVACLATAALLVLPASPTQACGGLFCQLQQPVNQAAERIVFSQNGDGTITAVVQIQYAGPSENFSWMLPVPQGEVSLDVSSNIAFTRLQQSSNPLYQLQLDIQGSCAQDPRGGFANAANEDSAGTGSDGGIVVVQEQEVGPYDSVIIAAEGISDPDEAAELAVTWLADNGYEIDELGRERLGPYLVSGMNLLAIRLSKGNDTGAIRPLIMTYTAECPMIPIRPTAVAAEENMGVMVWVLGEHRATPINYLALEINQALINWFAPNSNYNDVINLAADEAGGQGFVTERAGSSQDYAGVILNELENWDNNNWPDDDNQLFQQAFNLYGIWDGFREATIAHVTLPSGADVDEFLQCPSCFGPVSINDRNAFEDAIRTDVIEPVRRLQTIMVARPYVTRLYTTMSAADMTLDPEFDFNPDLPDYSNVHTATRTVHCAPWYTNSEAPWSVALPQGHVIYGSGAGNWPFAISEESAMPGNLRTLQIGTAGEGRVITDNSEIIASLINRSNANTPGFEEDGCACNLAHSTKDQFLSAWWLLLGFVALWLRRHP